MLRLTVPILGTTPVRILERARRVRSRPQGMGFAGTAIRVVWRHGLVTGYWRLRQRNCDEAWRGGVRVGTQRSSLTKEIV